MFDCNNTYWSLASGRIWSSRRACFVRDDDAALAAWLDQGQHIVPLPGGEEMLLDSLDIYGLSLGELAPPLTLAETRAAAFDALATRRWQAETAGISIGGMAIPTDRDSQALITGAVAGALIDPAQIITWKTAAKDANGVPVSVPLDADTIKAVAMAVRAHVQACFDIESDKGAELGALPDQDAIQAWLDTELDAGWPDSKQAIEAE